MTHQVKTHIPEIAERNESEILTEWIRLWNEGIGRIMAGNSNMTEMISRRQQELPDLSTPIVRFGENIPALPLIGTLDSKRTQVSTESLPQKIVPCDDRSRHRHHGRADRRRLRNPNVYFALMFSALLFKVG